MKTTQNTKRTSDFPEWCYNQHDVVCNQKYSDYNIPYSFHLKMVKVQAKMFEHLLSSPDFQTALLGCAGHDLIEDARITFNQIKDMVGNEIADVIYSCTEEKGRDRSERHSEKYYIELAKNRIAVFVKLCDIMANVKFGLMENSSMVKKYRNESIKVSEWLYREEFDEMFKYLDKLYSI